MTDDIDPSTQVRRPRPTDANSSNGTLAIVFAVIAVVVGFLILRSLGGSSSVATQPGGSGQTVASSLVPTGSSVAPPPTTVAPTNPAGAKILVANANGTKGSAGKVSDAIKGAGATMVKPVDAATELATSQILYDPKNPEALKVATWLSKSLTPSPTPAPLNGNPPIKGERQGADVILLLGKDLADAKVAAPVQPATTLTIAPAAPAAPTTTVAGG